MSKPGGDPCMGLFLSRSFGWAAHFFPSSVSLFDLKARLRPDPRVDTSARAGAVKVGRRTNLAACSALARPHLDGFEHDGTLGAIGMTIRGEPACGRDQSRHNLVFGGSNDPNHDAVMRIGSEAPKRRTHSSSRHDSHESPRDPATSNRHRRPVTTDGLGRNCRVPLATSVHCAGR
jgi:hypothetical protein